MPDPGEPTVVNLGAEYDDELRVALREVLRGSGAKLVDKTWGVGGSQLLETRTFELDGSTILIEAETFMGLTISSDAALVERVVASVRERLSGDRA